MKIIRTLLLPFLALFALTGVGIVANHRRTSPTEVHVHAAFRVYADSGFVDFSADRYMHVRTCRDDDRAAPTDPHEEQLKRIHLHDNNGVIAHVHRPDVRWSELFTNFGYVFPGPPRVYRNGQLVEASVSSPVLPDDRMLIIATPDDPQPERISQLTQQLPTVEDIRAAESASESC